MPEHESHAGEPRWIAPDELVRQLRNLEERIARIEDRLGASPLRPTAEASVELPAGATAELADTLANPGTALPAFGRALLGIAGAYFLRALTEMGVLPLGAGVSAGIVYAIVWLGLAAKTSSERRLDVTLRAVTSVLVLAPLIWEATVRFQAVSTWTAAAVLSCFTILGLVVSWRKNVTVIAWIALLAGVFTAWGLVLGTRDVFPFALALLAMAAAVEVSACLEHWLPERWVAAAGTNLGVLLLTYLAAQKTIPESYVALPAFAAPAAQAALLGIYLTSTIVRTLFRSFPFTSFETTQCAAVFLIAVGGAMTAGEGPGTVAVAMPAFTLLCGAACYVVAFAHLDRHGERNRNFYTYSVFGLLLTLTGSWMLLGPAALAVTWSALALSCIVAGGLWDRLTLRWHGVLYLLFATLASGAATGAGAMLLGAATGVAAVSVSGWTAVLAVLFCYAAALRYTRDAIHTRMYLGFSLAMSAMLVWHIAGLAAGGLTALVHSMADPAARTAYSTTARTAAITLGSIALAWSGARWRQPVLSRLVYALMFLGAYKLAVQDLRVDRTMALFLSLFLYGGALTLLPRLLQRGR
jgi:hypothetical protein